MGRSTLISLNTTQTHIQTPSRMNKLLMLAFLVTLMGLMATAAPQEEVEEHRGEASPQQIQHELEPQHQLCPRPLRQLQRREEKTKDESNNDDDDDSSKKWRRNKDNATPEDEDRTKDNLQKEDSRRSKPVYICSTFLSVPQLCTLVTQTLLTCK